MAELNAAMTSDGDDPPDLNGLENGSLELVTVEEEVEENKTQDVESSSMKSEAIEDDEEDVEDEDDEDEEGCFAKMIPTCLKIRIPWLVMLGAVGLGFWANSFGVLADVGSDILKGVEFLTGYSLSWENKDFEKGYV